MNEKVKETQYKDNFFAIFNPFIQKLSGKELKYKIKDTFYSRLKNTSAQNLQVQSEQSTE